MSETVIHTATSGQWLIQWQTQDKIPPPFYTACSAAYDIYIWYLEGIPSFQAEEEALTAEELRLAELYAEFADEDRQLAEMGLADYVRTLAEEETGYAAG